MTHLRVLFQQRPRASRIAVRVTRERFGTTRGFGVE